MLAGIEENIGLIPKSKKEPPSRSGLKTSEHGQSGRKRREPSHNGLHRVSEYGRGESPGGGMQTASKYHGTIWDP